MQFALLLYLGEIRVRLANEGRGSPNFAPIYFPPFRASKGGFPISPGRRGEHEMMMMMMAIPHKDERKKEEVAVYTTAQTII